MSTLKINCDVGEGVGNEIDLMPYLHYCNIACGGHAGDVVTMKKVVQLAIKHEVLIGAHPSYPDKEGFGRKSIDISEENLIDSIRSQIKFLGDITEAIGTSVYHVKPHGALYNDIVSNDTIAKVFLEAITPFKDSLRLFVPFSSVIEKLALRKGFSIIYEAFADRNYTKNLRLVSRTDKDAIISDVDSVINHVNEIINTGKVKTINNEKIELKASTFCVHSDTENAVELIKALHANV